MAESIVNCVLSKLTDAAVKEVLLLYDVDKQVEAVTREFGWIQAFMKDADKKQIIDERQKHWVKEVRDVAYLIEDVIDTFLSEVPPIPQKPTGMMESMKKKLKITKNLTSIQKLVHEITQIETRLSEIETRRGRYGINTLGEDNGEVKLPIRPPVLLDIDPDIVGFKDQNHVVKELLDETTKRRSVVSIWGIGGLGKTTLARKVYNCNDVKRQFELRIWVAISQKFELIDILRNIAKQLQLRIDSSKQSNDFLAEINESLRGKKYLIVLDDVWTDDLWTQIGEAHPNENKGSRVLITTRSREVAKAADPTCEPYKLGFLTKELSLDLFLKNALPNHDLNKNAFDDLSDIRDQFVHKCGGLPLALLVLGGLLSKKPHNYTAWSKVLQTMSWHADDGKKCSEIIGTSYEDLSFALKSCFMYFAAFPEDDEIYAPSLLRMWVAEGFIPQEDNRTLEETAESYLEDLVQSFYAMEFDLNEELGSDISLEVVEHRVIREWDLNAEPEPEVIEGSGESEIHQWDMNAEPEPDVVLDTVGQQTGELEVGEKQIVIAPSIGDDFCSVEEAHDYWKLYGFQTGFGVCKRTSHKKGGNVVACRFQCTKFREKREKVEEGEPFPERRRPSGNSNCKVFLKIKYSELTGSWRVSKLFLEHNHELTPGSSFLIPAYRYIPKRFKDMLEFNSDQGLSTADNIELVLKMAGGYFKGTFTRKDARNHIDKYKRGKLRALGGHDANLLADYFEKKQLCDSNFWYTYKHTNDAHLWNIFWADGRGRAAYKYYHDVVVMDATYLTNRYDMALVLFVGVNHHWQTVIFACALLGRETEEDYKWCMEKFVACMNGVKPGGILTDQCPSIEKGVRHVLGDDTVHRYCAWHILHKLPSKFGGQDDKDALTYLVKATVYEAKSPLDFEENWRKLMVEIGYEDAPWFKSIFRQRRKWVPVFLNDRFWAGMNTTQRVESMNAFFDNYLRSKATLAEFVVNFESGLSRIWEREHFMDHKDKTTTPVLISDLEFEKQFCSLYTNTIFYRFQHEVRQSLNLTCVFKLELENSTKVYEVEDILGNIFEVQYKEQLKEVFCICKKFEASGIVCAHSIMVLKHEKQLHVNDKYILDRWRKDKIRFDLIPAVCPDGSSVEINRRYDLTRKMNPIIEDFLNFGCVSDDKENKVLNGLEDLLNRLKGDVVSGSLVEQVVDGTSANDNGGSGGRAYRGRASGASRGEVHDVSTVPRKRARGRGKGQPVIGETNGDVTSAVTSTGRGQPATGETNGDTIIGYPITHDWDALIARLGRNEPVIHERNGESMPGSIVRGDEILMQSSSSHHQELNTTANEVLNSAPSINILPPQKSKRKGRPPKHAYKNPMDVNVKKNGTR